MLTLTYGYKKPETNDKGVDFFPALELNFQKLNDHTHNGSDSAKLTTASVIITEIAFSSGSWVSQGNGTYRQLLTMSGSMLFDNFAFAFKLSTGEFFYPKIEKVSANTFYLYINNNTLSGKVIILS
jgi:hypothetical protein